MSETVGFAFLAGSSIGFLAGLIFSAAACEKADKVRVKKGVMHVSGSIYKLTEINS